MQQQNEINATEKEPQTSRNTSRIFQSRRARHQRFYSMSGEEKSQNNHLYKFKCFAARWQRSISKKYEPIRTNKHTLRILKLISPIFTRVVIALIWFALIIAIAIPSPEGHGLISPSNVSDTSINETDQILNSTAINISETNGSYKLKLVLPVSSEHISVVLEKNNTQITSLNYRIDRLPTNEQVPTGLLADLSKDPYSIISLCLLVVFSSVMGYLFRLIWLPSLLGMMLAGIVYTHITYKWGNISPIPRSVSSILRSISLVVILSRGGLGISPSKLRARAFEILRLATIPCLGEAVTVAIACYLILSIAKEYWYWAAMSGCIVAAVSPAVVLPLMLHLQEKRYGTNKGIPTMVIAASSFDDVISISLFYIFLTLAYSTSDLAFTLVRGPLELLIGLVYGVIIGIIGRYIAAGEKQASINRNRLMFLLGGSLLAILGSKKVIINGSGLGGAGALGVVSSALLCSLSWKKEKELVEVSLKIIWQLAQPILFGIIGYEINFLKEGFDAIMIAKVISVIIIGLIARCLLAFLSVVCARGILLKEKLFIPIAWFPKATVQAAIGSVALDAATNDNQVYYSKIVLYIAVFSILITAPMGALLINFTGKRLVQKDDQIETENNKKSIKSTETGVTDISQCSKDSSSPLGAKKLMEELENGDVHVKVEHNTTT
ncbi:hypothetical protein LOD99_5594 [Oopsacas minuta]|uniref:Cation/H+ exchanger transmembrane domain-containing protein n=1 Tax=Oopsacas minuta TaxID=111878 RepID=A0AAV7JPT8_9METZ|nr:hypothetical protein LOD99_5594 [Oopsacas minuta]